MLHIEESLDSLTGARWFSTLDLASRYNQVPVTEGDRHKTALCTPFGLFKFNRMPFGFMQHPRYVPTAHEVSFWRSVLLYLDDVIVFSSTVKQHLHCLRWSELELLALKQHCHVY